MKKFHIWGLAVGILFIAVIYVTWLHLCHKPYSDLHKCEDNIRTIEPAINMYADAHAGSMPGGRRTVTRAECADLFRRELVPRFLKSIPTCPAAGRDTYSQGYRQDNHTPRGNATVDSFTIRCRGRFHMGAGVPPDFPVCTSSRGLLHPTKGSEHRQAFPEKIEVDAISLADNRADLQRKGSLWRHTEGEWGVNDDETFLPGCAIEPDTTVLLDASGRVKMVRGLMLTCTLGGEARGCKTKRDVSSVFGPPQWTVELGDHVSQWTYENSGVNLTVIGSDAPFCITLMRVSQ